MPSTMSKKLSQSWHRQQFTVTTERGAVAVDGIVNGPFGVHLRDGYYADVTHLASGCHISHGIFKQLGHVLTFCDLIAELTDWSREIVALSEEELKLLQQCYDRACSGTLL